MVLFFAGREIVVRDKQIGRQSDLEAHNKQQLYVATDRPLPTAAVVVVIVVAVCLKFLGYKAGKQVIRHGFAEADSQLSANVFEFAKGKVSV